MTVYESVLDTCKLYLGPAAEQFVTRQCALFLKIQPRNLGKQHLSELAKHIELTALRFMDEGKVRELSKKISAL